MVVKEINMSSFWRGRIVLITGSSGFVGLHLTKTLSKKGANVVGISKEGRTSKKDLKGDVTDYEFLEKVFKKFKVDTCFHLAAQSLVEEGLKDPLATFEVNVRGTWNILEVCRQNKVKKVVIASTAHVYGENKNPPYKEDDFLLPTRPYETSKVCSDLIAQTYADTYGLSVEIPRFVNIYGPGDLNFSRIIPKTIKAILEDKDPKIWGGKPVRDYLYIKDAISAYLLLAEKDFGNGKRNRVFNFGSGCPINAVKLAEKIIKIAGQDLQVEVVPSARKGEIDIQYVSFEKAKKALGWRPKYSLEKGLKKTYRWYKGFFSQRKVN